MFRAILLFTMLQQTAAVTITAPQPGMTVRGQVEILGSMDLPAFSSAELAFAYAPDSGGSWFTIQTFPQPVKESLLAVWDTSSVTDGDYDLRLRVFLLDGSIQEVTVADLKIRNDTPEPTVTPEEDIQPIIASALPSPAPPRPTQVSFQSTPVPPNPASLTGALVFSTFGRGVLITLALFAVISLFFRQRKN